MNINIYDIWYIQAKTDRADAPADQPTAQPEAWPWAAPDLYVYTLYIYIYISMCMCYIYIHICIYEHFLNIKIWKSRQPWFKTEIHSVVNRLLRAILRLDITTITFHRILFSWLLFDNWFFFGAPGDSLGGALGCDLLEWSHWAHHGWQLLCAKGTRGQTSYCNFQPKQTTCVTCANDFNWIEHREPSARTASIEWFQIDRIRKVYSFKCI